MKLLIALMSLTFSSLAFSSVNCRSIELLGNAGSSIILNEVNQEMAGYTQKLTKRKTLVIKRAESLSFSGCDMRMKVLVAVKRKIRRDAHGSVILKAKVSSFDGRKVCLSNTRVAKINLSNTLNIGEAVFKFVANKFLPNQTCFNI